MTFNTFIGYDDFFQNILFYDHSKQEYTHLTGIYKRKPDLIDFLKTMNWFSFSRLRGSENFHYILFLGASQKSID